MPAPTPSTYRVDSRVRRRLFPQSNGTSLSESAPASNSPLRGSSTTSVQMMNRSRPPTRRVLFRPRSGAIVRPSNSALLGSPLVHASTRQPPPFVIADDHDFSYDRTHHDRGAHASCTERMATSQKFASTRKHPAEFTPPLKRHCQSMYMKR
jgi:hypothetical protein